ncbi:4'-phosphopantetheinyl transferase superfamily protein [uncultured Methanobrevibacter sp.]|jgi:4'-phosphopantetheinyl transferase|uniref:4'-phosphopantetheinyl transferase family protein n=1 Tax=uncultured Methanobrevibacter sp. TaxID=253161 RepID=UPI0025D418A7|nr:4'-phosphopantetheinyl transferase superfamily protein [uncultured Methanobrevibacter sp.]
MIKLAYCNVDDLNLKIGYNLVPQDRKNKINTFRFDKDKKLSCGAYLLLKKLLSEINIYNPIIKLKKYGKSYISNYDNIYFNLSHSGKLVSCAISDKPIGVDIEYNDPTIDLNIAKNFFFNEEYENIMKSENPSNEFFKYWVLKESYMKYTGMGFHLDLDSFQINIGEKITLKNDKNNLKFSLFDVYNYKLACAGKYEVKKYYEYNVKDLY